jgi:heme-degrading monooxygenase HmoA
MRFFTYTTLESLSPGGKPFPRRQVPRAGPIGRGHREIAGRHLPDRWWFPAAGSGTRDSMARIATRERRQEMITEIAQIEVKPGMESEFEAAVKKATPIFKRSKGCRGMELRRSIEKPSRYRLLVTWETVEDHTVGFRNSPEFQEWRGLVGHFFASPPEVEHVQQVVHGF